MCLCLCLRVACDDRGILADAIAQTIARSFFSETVAPQRAARHAQYKVGAAHRSIAGGSSTRCGVLLASRPTVDRRGWWQRGSATVSVPSATPFLYNDDDNDDVDDDGNDDDNGDDDGYDGDNDNDNVVDDDDEDNNDDDFNDDDDGNDVDNDNNNDDDYRKFEDIGDDDDDDNTDDDDADDDNEGDDGDDDGYSITMTMAMAMTNTRTTTMTTTINGVNTWFEQVYNCRVVYKAQTRDGKGVTQEDWRELCQLFCVLEMF